MDSYRRRVSPSATSKFALGHLTKEEEGLEQMVVGGEGLRDLMVG